MVLLTAGAQTFRARRRHRALLALIAREDPAVPGVRVLDHPSAAAYCVPGLRSQVVVSEGALKLLSADELTAVLAHEAAHVRERHDLVLLPFAALRRATALVTGGPGGPARRSACWWRWPPTTSPAVTARRAAWRPPCCASAWRAPCRPRTVRWAP